MRKTYIVAGLMTLLSAAKFFGMIDEEVYQSILGLLTAGGIATLRMGMTTNAVAASAQNAIIAKTIGVPAPIVEDKIASTEVVEAV